MGCAEAADAIQAGVLDVRPDADVTRVPMADGGDGTVEAIVTGLHGTSISVPTTDPLDRPCRASFGWIADRQLAVIEMAAASGLWRLADDELDPDRASTRGTGDVVRAALDRGARTILIGLGGSATVDGGTGFLEALGARLLDGDGRPLRGGGEALGRIASVDVSGLDPRLRKVDVLVASDVTSPLLGPKGAVHVFGPQKGVRHEDLERMDSAMAAFADAVRRSTGRDHRMAPGAGAAGGFGFAMFSFFDASMRNGVELIAETVGLADRIAGADLVITGEGALDGQSLFGKVPVGVARLARDAGVPAAALVGRVDGDREAFRAEGLTVVLPIVDTPMTLAEAMAAGPRLLRRASRRLVEVLELGRSIRG